MYIADIRFHDLKSFSFKNLTYLTYEKNSIICFCISKLFIFTKSDYKLKLKVTLIHDMGLMFNIRADY